MSAVVDMVDGQPVATPAGVRDDESSVLVIDDHALVAQGVVLALSAAGVRARACVPVEGHDPLEEARLAPPSVVLLDLILTGCPVSSLELLGPLRELGAEVVIFTGTTDPVLLGAALEAGALGLVSKADPVDDLVASVRRAGRHENLVPAGRRAVLLDELRRHRAAGRARLAPFRTLTQREGVVLERLMQGDSAETIASTSYVSLATVRTQIRAILTKLGVNSQLAAVAMAYRAGWPGSGDPPS